MINKKLFLAIKDWEMEWNCETKYIMWQKIFFTFIFCYLFFLTLNYFKVNKA